MKNTTQSRQDESFFAKASGYTRIVLNALATSPLAAQAMKQVEDERLEERRAILAARARLRADYPALKKPMAIAAEKAALAAQAAERNFIAARAEHQRLSALEYGQEAGYRSRCMDMDRELLESADPRLAAFIAAADGIISNDLVLALEFWIDVPESRYGQTRQRSNGVEVEAAKNAVRKAMAEAAAMQTEAIGYVDVSQRLMGLCAEMAPALAPLRINPPTLTAEHAEVGRPASWSGQSRWVFDETPKTADELKALDRKDAQQLHEVTSAVKR